LEDDPQYKTDFGLENPGKLIVIGEQSIYLEGLKWPEYPPQIAMHEYNRITGYVLRLKANIDQIPGLSEAEKIRLQEDMTDSRTVLGMIEDLCPGINLICRIHTYINTVAREFYRH